MLRLRIKLRSGATASLREDTEKAMINAMNVVVIGTDDVNIPAEVEARISRGREKEIVYTWA